MTSKYFTSLLFGFILLFPISNLAYAQTPTQTINVTNSAGQLVTDVKYGIINGTVNNIVVSPSDDTVDISVTTTDNGTLAITLPRTLIDATVNGQDNQFFVLVDGQNVDFQESKTATDRTLTISFPDGASDIAIVGTSATPEFGSIAPLILVVSIFAIIAVTFKTKLNISKV
jgi:predicted secreted protein with PEFG-CTERM motif